MNEFINKTCTKTLTGEHYFIASSATISSVLGAKEHRLLCKCLFCGIAHFPTKDNKYISVRDWFGGAGVMPDDVYIENDTEIAGA